ncbi:MAG TPA: hypothetical protein VFZ44_13650 [Pyrinomonadaceae bacterium]
MSEKARRRGGADAPPPAGGAPRGRIITFYSYKGGTGRSMSLANVAWILASAGQRVLTIDWDLEAPGLHRYFSPFLRDPKLAWTEGLIEFADEYRTAAMTPPEDEESSADWYLTHADLSHYAVRLDWEFDGGGYIDFVPAGRQDEGYSGLVNAFNWKSFYTELSGNRLLEAAKDIMRRDYDYILIDSRTGVSDTSSICTVKMPDALVVCFTLNNQGIEGAASVARSVYGERGETIRIFPVPMRLDNGELQKLTARSEYAREQFYRFPNFGGDGASAPSAALRAGRREGPGGAKGRPAPTKQQYWKEVPVNYVSYYSYEEVLAPFAEKDARLASMLASAERLASYLTDGAVMALRPPDDKLRLKKLAEYEGREAELTPAEEVSAAAQAAFEHFATADREAARRLLLRLVRVPRPDEKAMLARKQVAAGHFGGVSTLLDRLLTSGVIQLAGTDDDGEPVFELVNDELLHEWDDLRKWVEEDREFLLWRQQMRVEMAEWREAAGPDISGWVGEARRRALRGNHYKLLAGRGLEEARRWLGKRPDDLNDEEAAYIRASDAARSVATGRLVMEIAGIAVAVLALFFGAWQFFRGTPSPELPTSADVEDARRLADEAEKQVQEGLTSPGLTDGDAVRLGALLALESQRLAPSDRAQEIVRRATAALARRVSTIKYFANVQAVAWSADGKRVTTVSGSAENVNPLAPPGMRQLLREDRVVEVRDASTGVRVVNPMPFQPGVTNFVLSPDGRFVAFSRVSSGDSAQPSGGRVRYYVELLNVTTGELRLVDTRDARVYEMIFSPDSRRLITAGDESTALLADVEGDGVWKVRHKYRVITAAFSPDSSEFLTVTDGDSMARLYSVSNPEVQTDAFKVGGVTSKVLFTPPDGRRVVKLLDGSALKYAAAWDLEEKRETRFEHGVVIRDLAVSPDGRYVATLGVDSSVAVWEIETGRPMRTDMGITGSVNEVFFGPESYLVAAGDRPVACVWVAPGFTGAVLLTHESRFIDVAFSPQTGRVATAAADGSVRVWEFGAGGGEANPCERLTRNLTSTEWAQYLPNRPYQITCTEAAN